MPLRYPLDHRSDEATGNVGHISADADFPGARIQEKFDISQALLQCVEGVSPSLEKFLTINRKLHTTWATIDKSNAYDSLKICNCLRYSRLGDRQVGCCFRHAPVLR